MIRTFGLHWKSEHIDWGHPGVSGTLLGAASRSTHARSVDFREQRGIYALYAEYELVYIGQTGAGDDRLFKRLRHHRRDHLAERWDRFSWFGLLSVTRQNKLSTDTVAVHVDTGQALNIMEAVSIAIAEPRLNLQRGRWGEAKQYYQFIFGCGEEGDDD